MTTQQIQAGDRKSPRTRTGRAWAAITFGLAGLVVVLVFALQNLGSVRVTFLNFHGSLPLAVLLLLVAVVGALVVFSFGAARIVQLRLQARRSERPGARAPNGDMAVTRVEHA